MKISKPVKNSIFVECVQATPTCQSSRVINKLTVEVQPLDRLTIVTLDLLEINILYSLELSVAAT